MVELSDTSFVTHNKCETLQEVLASHFITSLPEESFGFFPSTWYPKAQSEGSMAEATSVRSDCPVWDLYHLMQAKQRVSVTYRWARLSGHLSLCRLVGGGMLLASPSLTIRRTAQYY